MLNATERLLSPKLDQKVLAPQFRYYAGFSDAFVEQIVQAALRLRQEPVVFDPWLGAGTTTAAAARAGVPSFGIDANPVMIVVAKSRLFHQNQSKIEELRKRLSRIKTKPGAPLVSDDDPLLMWFGPTTAGVLRHAQQILCEGIERGHDGDFVSALNSAEALGLTALFNICRRMLKELGGSNPTWVRRGALDRRKGLAASRLFERLDGELLRLFALAPKHRGASSTVSLGDSRRLPFEDESFDLVVTSPPYCTRIDYAIKTTVEMACLGFEIFSDFRGIRTRLIGTPAITKESPEPEESWGATCLRFLDSVRHHYSKASVSYYYKTHAQYFGSMVQSLRELARVLVTNGTAAIVVQDSYYKEIHNDVARIVQEMCEYNGLALTRMDRFESKRTMSYINSAGRSYRGRPPLTESVLFLRKQ